MKVDSYWATPILRGDLPDASELNSALSKLFLRYEQEPARPKKQPRFNTTRGRVFDSDFDLFQWPDESIQRLASAMHGALGSAVMQLNGYTVDYLNCFHFHYHAWFHITRRGGVKTIHNHPNASWSLVYYVDAGDSTTSDERSGYIQFYDPRAASNAYQDAGNMNLHRTFSFNGLSIAPKTGMLLMFPSYLYHEVLTYWGDRPRIMVAANAWMKPSQIAENP